MDLEAFIANHRIARLATMTQNGRPHLVPVVYAYDGTRIFIALDQKAKRVSPTRLQRVRNIETNPHVSLLVDDYSEDWTQLAWVRMDGVAHILQDGEVHVAAINLLREKYPQYRLMKLEERPVIQITIQRTAYWEARSDGR
jgi:PPOX class probable F420-dependent enzyme